MKPLLILQAIAVLATAAEVPRAYPKPPAYEDSPAKKEERMRWFREARFGMFIHWGL